MPLCLVNGPRAVFVRWPFTTPTRAGYVRSGTCSRSKPSGIRPQPKARHPRRSRRRRPSTRHWTGADFVFSAIRVGGLEGRVVDERLALDLGLLGQETTGPGGVGYGLRTVPVALAIAERVGLLAPDAWVINFTNPAGLVTQAMQSVLGDRVVGICDSPLGLAKRAAGALGLRLSEVVIDYAGTNHLGWLHGLSADGRDVLPELLADRERLESFEEGRLFGADWLQAIRAIPNEYLWYYDFTRDSIAQIREAGQTRGEYLLGQQGDFYAAVRRSPGTGVGDLGRRAPGAQRHLHGRDPCETRASRGRPRTWRAAAMRGWRSR